MYLPTPDAHWYEAGQLVAAEAIAEWIEGRIWPTSDAAVHARVQVQTVPSWSRDVLATRHGLDQVLSYTPRADDSGRMRHRRDLADTLAEVRGEVG